MKFISILFGSHIYSSILNFSSNTFFEIKSCNYDICGYWIRNGIRVTISKSRIIKMVKLKPKRFEFYHFHWVLCDIWFHICTFILETYVSDIWKKRSNLSNLFWFHIKFPSSLNIILIWVEIGHIKKTRNSYLITNFVHLK